MAPSCWRELFESPGSDRHVVQVYRDARFMEEAVAHWLAPTLRGGGAVFLLASAANAPRVLDALRASGLDPSVLQTEGRLLVADVDTVLAQVLVNGMPQADRVMPIIRAGIAKLRAASNGEVRAWGEAVDVLVKRGKVGAAERLEAIWNDIIAAERIHLLCSYELDHLAPEGAALLPHVCRGHSQLVPEADYAAFDLALGQSLVELLGEDEAANARTRYARRRTLHIGMPSAEAVLLALREEQPELGERLVQATRTRLAPR